MKAQISAVKIRYEINFASLFMDGNYVLHYMKFKGYENLETYILFV